MKEKKIGLQHIVYISHAEALADAMKAKAAIEEAFEGIETHILELSPAFVTQGGPQCVAIQYIVR